MAKSIRSKCKRKARAEFRRTIGSEFHKKNQEKIQEKLKECVEKSNSTKSLDKIANLFHNSNDNDNDNEEGETSMDISTTAAIALETSETNNDDVVNIAPAENKARPVRKTKRSRKHSIKKQKQTTKASGGEKRRPKYFVQF